VINKETKSSFTVQQVEGRFKTILSSYRRYKDAMNKTGSERKEYEFANEMDEIFGESHCTKPAFLVESSSAGPSTSKKRTYEALSDSSDDAEKDEEPVKSPVGTEKSRRRNKKQCRSMGASQMIDFLTTYIQKEEKREEEEKKKREEEKQRADNMHREQMRMLGGLTEISRGCLLLRGT
jgi:hypothetical protein